MLPLLALLAAAPAAAEPVASLVALPDPLRTGRLVSPAGEVTPPLVILLPDALGADGREEPYVDSLLARGVASLVLGLGEDLDHPAVSQADPAASTGAVAIAIGWAVAAGYRAEAIGLMGFGAGGRAVLAGGAAAPALALYPGCRDLPLPAAPALIVQGGLDAADCGTLRPHLRLRLLPDAGHGWDAPGAIWPSPGPLLPDPIGEGFKRARADHAATLEAAELAADWFETFLQPSRARAAR
jgi:dienelactone hydrolase